MKCTYCGTDLVERKPMVHDTRKGTRARLDLRPARKGWFCPSCKRVQRGTDAPSTAR